MKYVRNTTNTSPSKYILRAIIVPLEEDEDIREDSMTVMAEVKKSTH
jgi:hypothetical protein